MRDKTARFVTDRSACLPSQEVVELTSYTSVYDLTCCPVRTQHGYYHKLMDCLVPSMPTLHAALGSDDRKAHAAILPSHLSEVYDVVLGDTTLLLDRKTFDMRKGSSCYVLANNQSLVTNGEAARPPPAAWTGFRAAVNHGLDKLVPDRGTVARPNAITVIQRHKKKGRVFGNLDDIVRAFQSAFPKWTVHTFHGNETVVDIMAMFARSQVIVGYHGAGLANAIFSPPGAVVLEYTTLDDLDATEVWRSNIAVAQHVQPNLTWIQHAVEVHELDFGQQDPAAIDVVRHLRNHRERDLFLKGAENVYVSPVALFNSIARVKAALV